ncbi:MAG: filamentous hemagglutinin N-terminal domain-containing protein, partial [Cyanobacteria bacterium P01_D01_bin.56]
MVNLSGKWWLGGMAGLVHFIVPGSTLAQSVESDNTLAPDVSNVTFSPGNNTFEITGGQVSGDQRALFHSFSEFSVPLGSTAFFNHDASVQNIIGRVTGDSTSVIDGSIRTGGTADLFLLNPNGIIFGPEAKLEINGSFLATTADRILFEGGEFFSATEVENQPLLTVGVPIGLQFGQTPGSIINRSVSEGVGLQVPRRETLALVGSDVIFDQGGMNAQYGRLEVGSVAANSFIDITPASEGWALSYEAVEDFRDIELQQATISTDGPDPTSLIDILVPSSGDIQLRGRDIVITNDSKVLVPRFIISDAVGDLIIISSDSVEISDSSILSTNVSFGTAGSIFIETERLVIKDLGSIDGSTVSVSEFRTGGNLTIRAQDSVELQNGFIATDTSSSQDAGNIDIQTARLTLVEGSQISTVTQGSGNAGVLNISTTESVLISDTSGINPSGLFSRTSSTGNAGRVSVETEQLTIQDGGRISVAAEPDETGGLVLGDAGSALIQAEQISLQDNGQITAANVSSTSEGIQLQGVDSLSVSGGSQITAS